MKIYNPADGMELYGLSTNCPLTLQSALAWKLSQQLQQIKAGHVTRIPSSQALKVLIAGKSGSVAGSYCSGAQSLKSKLIRDVGARLKRGQD